LFTSGGLGLGLATLVLVLVSRIWSCLHHCLIVTPIPLLQKNLSKIQPELLMSNRAYRQAPCGLRGCKNGPAPFPDRMSYKAIKPGLVFVLYLSMFLLC